MSTSTSVTVSRCGCGDWFGLFGFRYVWVGLGRDVIVWFFGLLVSFVWEFAFLSAVSLSLIVQSDRVKNMGVLGCYFWI
jgi:hypothetical protein